jgi:hypothetical protein
MLGFLLRPRNNIGTRATISETMVYPISECYKKSRDHTYGTCSGFAIALYIPVDLGHLVSKDQEPNLINSDFKRCGSEHLYMQKRIIKLAHTHTLDSVHRCHVPTVPYTNTGLWPWFVCINRAVLNLHLYWALSLVRMAKWCVVKPTHTF